MVVPAVLMTATAVLQPVLVALVAIVALHAVTLLPVATVLTSLPVPISLPAANALISPPVVTVPSVVTLMHPVQPSPSLLSASPVQVLATAVKCLCPAIQRSVWPLSPLVDS
jgi:hypothetical protein